MHDLEKQVQSVPCPLLLSLSSLLPSDFEALKVFVFITEDRRERRDFASMAEPHMHVGAVCLWPPSDMDYF